MSRRVFDVLKERGVAVRENVPTAPLCTIKIGGSVALFIEPICKNELVDTILLLKNMGYPYALIGKGSNVVFDDGTIPIALIRTTALNATRLHGNVLSADCGASLFSLACLAARGGFSDLDFCCGIPGTLGGALVMNAGAYGKCLAQYVHAVRVLLPRTGEIKTLFRDELAFSYRNSVFQSEDMVALDAELSLFDHDDPGEVFSRMRALNAKRRQTQPLEFPSAGSVFRRPFPNVPISRMLDELGCKGMRIGGAAVSQKHAGFIVNLGGATAADVKALILCLQNKLEKERGIRPRSEWRFIPEEI